MRSLVVHNNSNMLPTAGSHSPVRKDYPNSQNRSIARYLKSHADRSMFRDNALIDPHVQKYYPISSHHLLY